MAGNRRSSHKTIVSATMIRVVPLAAMLLILIWLSIRYIALGTLQEEVRNSLRARTQITAERIWGKLESLKAYAASLTTNDLVVNGLIDYAARENYLPTFFQSLKIPGADNARVFLADYKGRQIVSSTGEVREIKENSTVKQMLQGKHHIQITEGFMEIALPVFYGGHPEGILLVWLSSDDYTEFFRMDSGFLEIAVILKPDTELFTTHPFISEKTPGMADTGRQWLIQTADVPKYPHLKVLCGINRDEALGQYARMEDFLVAAMILDLMALVIGIFMSARLTGRPLTIFADLIDKARKSKRYMANLPETGPKEIISMARAFNALIKELEQVRAESLNKAIEAGRAQLSAMVLHNIGNAVTPLGVQLNRMKDKKTDDILTYLAKCYDELKDHKADLSEYVQNDTRGKQVFSYMGELIDGLTEKRQEQNGKIEKARDATAYISEILSLQQNYAPSSNETKQKINLNDIMATTLRIQRPALEKRNITVRTDLEPEMRPLIIDKSRLLQISVNLLKNSYEAIDQFDTDGTKEKAITIRTFSTDHTAGFEITDTGIGIDPSRIDTIFEFGKSGKGSSGMGLYYCKMFMEANEGDIVVTSSGAGKGTSVKAVFHFSGKAGQTAGSPPVEFEDQ